MPLKYYDRILLVTVQVDTFLKGLGACLVQKHNRKDQPIAFASKSLTDVETGYANVTGASFMSMRILFLITWCVAVLLY